MGAELQYRKKYVYAEDYGTGYFKYGPITIGENPRMIQNRGLLIREKTAIHEIFKIERDVIVGDEEIPKFLGSREDLVKNLVYPMRDGIVKIDDEDAWKVIKAVTRYGFEEFYPVASRDPNFKGYYVVAALSALAPKYMYEKLFELHKELDSEFDNRLIKAMTIIPQPLAVAIAEKALTCLVVECGHGNIQICPISYYPIRKAIVALNRGGAEANAITREILKDCGYGDLAREEYVVEKVKREIGLVPKNLKEAIKKAKEEKERFRAKVKIDPVTEIDLGDNSWMRFLIGEIVFNPSHEEFMSYISQGRLVIEDIVIGDQKLYGTLDLASAIIEAIRVCPVEIRSRLFERIILSGGAFMWSVPPNLRDVACDSATKIELMISEKLPEMRGKVSISLVKDPQYSVWRGCIVYGFALPGDYKWDWSRLEGWYSWK